MTYEMFIITNNHLLDECKKEGRSFPGISGYAGPVAPERGPVWRVRCGLTPQAASE